MKTNSTIARLFLTKTGCHAALIVVDPAVIAVSKICPKAKAMLDFNRFLYLPDKCIQLWHPYTGYQ